MIKGSLCESFPHNLVLKAFYSGGGGGGTPLYKP